MKTYPSKLLIFGEYVLMQGSEALAIPLPLYAGHWSFEVSENSAALASKESLAALVVHLQNNPAFGYLDLPTFQKDLQNGLWFNSNIPNGYGLGSSGAVVAAIYDRYARKITQNLHEIQTQLAQIEAFWHGKSSGLDPLVAYIAQPIHIDVNGIPSVANIPNSLLKIWLLDTQQARKTAPLVAHFVENLKQPSFVSDCVEPLKSANKSAIQHFLAHNWLDFWATLRQISSIEQQYFQPMIPSDFRAQWVLGLETDAFLLKLCGAGGGGFILGFGQIPTQKNLLELSDCLRELYDSRKSSF